MNGHKLDISSFTQLGLSVSSNLMWKPHIIFIAKHASQKLGFLSRARGYFSPSQLLTIYRSQIHPSLEYCSHVWGGAPKSSLNLLDRVQSKAIRLINNSFRRQRNLCVKLFRREKRNFYKNLNISDITDNKKFWKTVKPVLSDKGQSSSKIILIENDTIISNDNEVAETLNGYFISITDSLGLTENTEVIVSDPIDSAIIKYSNHPSIRKQSKPH